MLLPQGRRKRERGVGGDVPKNFFMQDFATLHTLQLWSNSVLGNVLNALLSLGECDFLGEEYAPWLGPSPPPNNNLLPTALNLLKKPLISIPL